MQVPKPSTIKNGPLQQTFDQLNSFFDHIYVISLPRATERHLHIKEELEGLDYSLFWGKDNKYLDIQELKKSNIYNEKLAIKHHRYNKAMSIGAIGCSLSHLLVYQDILINNYDKVLILEDDVVFNKETVSSLSKILKEMPEDWELFYLGFNKNEPLLKRYSIHKMYYHFLRFLNGIKLSHKEISNRFPKKISDSIYKAGYHDCAHAYAITKCCAKKLIHLQTPIIFPADHLLAYVATNDLAKSYISLPKITCQLDEVSTTPVHSYTME